MELPRGSRIEGALAVDSPSRCAGIFADLAIPSIDAARGLLRSALGGLSFTLAGGCEGGKVV